MNFFESLKKLDCRFCPRTTMTVELLNNSNQIQFTLCHTVPHESVTIDRHISNKGYFSS